MPVTGKQRPYGKAHKIAERLGDGDQGRTHRVKAKDAGDVYRLMTSPASPTQIGTRLRELADDPICGVIVRTGVDHLDRLFGVPNAAGVALAAQALAAAVPEDRIRQLVPAYLAAFLAAYRG